MGSATRAKPSTTEANDTTLTADFFIDQTSLTKSSGQRQDIASSAASARLTALRRDCLRSFHTVEIGARYDPTRRQSMSQKAAEHHRKAAEHHEHAAKHHQAAADHHERGDHQTAGHHAHVAEGHHVHAEHHAEEASKHHANDH